MDIEALKRVVDKKGFTPTQMAAICGISTQCWYNKLNQKSKFNVDEAEAIKRSLKLSNEEVATIFFRKKSDSKSLPEKESK